MRGRGFRGRGLCLSRAGEFTCILLCLHLYIKVEGQIVWWIHVVVDVSDDQEPDVMMIVVFRRKRGGVALTVLGDDAI